MRGRWEASWAVGLLLPATVQGNDQLVYSLVWNFLCVGVEELASPILRVPF